MSTTPTAQAVRGICTPKPTTFGVFSTASAMEILWLKASKDMGLRELEWFADGAAQLVESSARSLAGVLMVTGYLIECDDSGPLDADGKAGFIFNVQHQLCTIAGLAAISVDAGICARQACKDGAA